MNCKPGDLAVIVRASIPSYEENLGKLVRVITPYIGGVIPGHSQEYESPGGWIVASEGGLLRISDTAVIYGTHHVCGDCSLRPIRDPGEDAQDETLSWLPVPTEHKETA